MLLLFKGRLPSKGVFNQRSSSIKDRLPSKSVFHQRLSSIKALLPSKIIFHHRSFFIKECLPSKVIFNQRVSSINQKSSSIKGHLPSKVVFHQWPSIRRMIYVISSNKIVCSDKSKKIWSKNLLFQEKFGQKMLVENLFCLNIFGSEKYLVHKDILSQKLFGQKIVFAPKNFRFKNNLGSKRMFVL